LYFLYFCVPFMLLRAYSVSNYNNAKRLSGEVKRSAEDSVVWTAITRQPSS